jgi:hypothetical protein
MAARVIRTMAWLGAVILGSGTDSTRTSRGPWKMVAFIATSLYPLRFWGDWGNFSQPAKTDIRTGSAPFAKAVKPMISKVFPEASDDSER